MEVPIAVPLRVPVPQPNHQHRPPQQEEMDISTAASAPIPSLSNFSSPPRSQLPSSVKLGGARGSTESEDLGRQGRVMSFDGTVRSGGRRGSLGWLGGGRHEEEEGDLGYAVLEGGEGARRKVIAERLETVKARNPVFTWC